MTRTPQRKLCKPPAHATPRAWYGIDHHFTVRQYFDLPKQRTAWA